MQVREPIGPSDYWRMARSRGWALPLAFLREVHWYDLRHGTRTAGRVPVADFDVHPGLTHGSVMYMASWTSVIRNLYGRARGSLGQAFPQMRVIDIGCGKGKFLCVWSDQLRGDGIQQEVIGIDFSANFIETARENLDRRGHVAVDLVLSPASDVDPEMWTRSPTLLYLYNPFSAESLEVLLNQVNDIEAWLAYCNPVHSDVVVGAGFQLVHEWVEWHPNQWVHLYRRSPGSSSRPNEAPNGPHAFQ